MLEKHPHLAFLGLGSNLGDREETIRQAIRELANTPHITLLKQSRLYETDPVGDIRQNRFINAVIKISTALEPEDLLAFCLQTERKFHRVRHSQRRFGPRTLDVDILFYDDLVWDTPTLTLPHPRLHERCFMLVPMMEIEKTYQHPVLDQSLQEMLEALRNQPLNPNALLQNITVL